MRAQRVIIIILLFLVVSAPSYAINIFETIIYKKDVIKNYNAKILANPLTNEIKYIWYDTIPSHTNGHWVAVSGTVKDQFQVMYDQQNNHK